MMLTERFVLMSKWSNKLIKEMMKKASLQTQLSTWWTEASCQLFALPYPYLNQFDLILSFYLFLSRQQPTRSQLLWPLVLWSKGAGTLLLRSVQCSPSPPTPHTHPETRIWRKSAMRSASGTGEERERQWLKRPDAVRTLAESGAGPHSQDSQGIVLPSAYQGGPNPIQWTPLPPPWQGEEVFAWMGEKKEGREELDSPKHLPVLISSFSAVGCT